MEALSDQLLAIADDTTRDTVMVTGQNGQLFEKCDREWIERSKLRVHTRMFLMSKLASNVYGNKFEQSTNSNTVTKFTLKVGNGSREMQQTGEKTSLKLPDF